MAAKQHLPGAIFIECRPREIQLLFNISAKDIGINQRHVLFLYLDDFTKAQWEARAVKKRYPAIKNTLSFISTDLLLVCISDKVKT